MKTLATLALSLSLSACAISTSPPLPAREPPSPEHSLLYVGDVGVQYHAVIDIYKHHDRSACTELRALLESSRRDPIVRGMAAYTLGTLDDSESAPLLRKVASTDSEEVCVRDGAIVALGLLRDSGAIPLLSQIVNSPAELPYVRADASRALSRITPDYKPLSSSDFRSP